MVSNFGNKIWRVVLISLTVLGGAFLFAVLLFTFLKSPKEKAQARELEYMKLKYEILNDRLDDLEALMTDMEQRDNDIYRVMFEADPIPSQVRRSGFLDADRYVDLYGYMNSGMVVNTARKLDVIASQLYNQSVSYDELFDKARNKSDMLAHIPRFRPYGSIGCRGLCDRRRRGHRRAEQRMGLWQHGDPRSRLWLQDPLCPPQQARSAQGTEGEAWRRGGLHRRHRQGYGRPPALRGAEERQTNRPDQLPLRRPLA